MRRRCCSCQRSHRQADKHGQLADIHGCRFASSKLLGGVQTRCHHPSGHCEAPHSCVAHPNCRRRRLQLIMPCRTHVPLSVLQGAVALGGAYLCVYGFDSPGESVRCFVEHLLPHVAPAVCPGAESCLMGACTCTLLRTARPERPATHRLPCACRWLPTGWSDAAHLEHVGEDSAIHAITPLAAAHLRPGVLAPSGRLSCTPHLGLQAELQGTAGRSCPAGRLQVQILRDNPQNPTKRKCVTLGRRSHLNTQMPVETDEPAVRTRCASTRCRRRSWR